VSLAARAAESPGAFAARSPCGHSRIAARWLHWRASLPYFPATEHNRPVLAQIQVEGRDETTQLGDLWDWLRRERGLAGRVELAPRPPGPTDLGGVFEVLTVTLGSGGSAAVLARSLGIWLKTRRPDVTVTVTTEAGSVTVKASTFQAMMSCFS